MKNDCVISLLAIALAIPAVFAITGLPAGSRKMAIHNKGNVDFYGGAPVGGAYAVKHGTNRATIVERTAGKKVIKIDVYQADKPTEYNVYFVIEDETKIQKVQNAINDLKSKAKALEQENKKFKSVNSELAKLKTKAKKQDDDNKKTKSDSDKCTRELKTLKNKTGNKG